MQFRLKAIAAIVLTLNTAEIAQAESFDPQVGLPGSLAISRDDSRFVEWASGFSDLVRGPQNIANPGGPTATVGTGAAGLGQANGSVVSLGDGGRISLSFDVPITNGPGADFAVFENGFGLGAGLAYLELAFVEVSSNGIDFFRFDAVSLTQTSTQIGGFGVLDASNLNNLAGKHIGGYGTGFDLEELVGVSPLLNVRSVKYVRLIDVIGTINPSLGTRDSRGNLINDPYATPFGSGGFDLDGVGVLNVVPEPASLALVAIGLVSAGLMTLRNRRRRV